ncbi:hypothetical protein [Neobacillus sp. FSL H8-0543]|uniref:hypothetical protein n=1 Tax=Neobacillus sp. FSL H8-0543 TaxID=2954672 RepID=UPI0031596227
MTILIFVSLFAIAVYTFGFAVTLWKEKQKGGALSVFFLTLTIVVLPFFSIYKIQ